MKEIHEYQCEICGYRSGDKKVMRAHEKKHRSYWKLSFYWPKFPENGEIPNAFVEWEEVNLVPCFVNQIMVTDHGDSDVSLIMYSTIRNEKRALKVFMEAVEKYLKRLNTMKTICYSRCANFR